MDRYEASKTLSRIAVVKEVGGIQVPGTPWATPPAELEKLAGYGRDINASRAEARRLLREAGVPDGYAFTFKNRGIPQPYEPLGIWLIDQWRQIGLNVKQETIEASAYHPMLKRGDFDVAMDFQCSFVIEPDIDIEKFQSAGVSDRNWGRYKDPVLDDLFVKQARAARSRGAQAAPARLREAAARRGGALHLHAAAAPHHPAQQQGPGVDDHARPLPEPAARYGLAGRVGRGLRRGEVEGRTAAALGHEIGQRVQARAAVAAGAARRGDVLGAGRAALDERADGAGRYTRAQADDHAGGSPAAASKSSGRTRSSQALSASGDTGGAGSAWDSAAAVA